LRQLLHWEDKVLQNVFFRRLPSAFSLSKKSRRRGSIVPIAERRHASKVCRLDDTDSDALQQVLDLSDFPTQGGVALRLLSRDDASLAICG
jgi:hypothetical protein